MNPSSGKLMSGCPNCPRWPVTASPAYTFARSARYEFRSLKMLALVTVLFGSVVKSVQPAAASDRTAAAATVDGLSVLRFIDPSPLESDAEPAGEGARSRIDVVVDAVQPRRRIDTAVAGNGKHVLHAGGEVHRPTAILERVAKLYVVHAQEGPVLHVYVRELLIRHEAGL